MSAAKVNGDATAFHPPSLLPPPDSNNSHLFQDITADATADATAAEGDELVAPRKPTSEEIWWKRAKVAATVVVAIFSLGGWYKGLILDNATRDAKIATLEDVSRKAQDGKLDVILQGQQTELEEMRELIQALKTTGSVRKVHVPAAAAQGGYDPQHSGRVSPFIPQRFMTKGIPDPSPRRQ